MNPHCTKCPGSWRRNAGHLSAPQHPSAAAQVPRASCHPHLLHAALHRLLLLLLRVVVVLVLRVVAAAASAARGRMLLLLPGRRHSLLCVCVCCVRVERGRETSRPSAQHVLHGASRDDAHSSRCTRARDAPSTGSAPRCCCTAAAAAARLLRGRRPTQRRAQRVSSLCGLVRGRGKRSRRASDCDLMSLCVVSAVCLM